MIAPAKANGSSLPVPHGHWKTTTFVAGLRQGRITALLVIDCPMIGHIFETYVDKWLAPTLSPGDIVVMDSLSAHKVRGIRQAIEDKKAHLLYLPPYSPELNPIEMFFSKLKVLLKKAAERSIDAFGNGPAKSTTQRQSGNARISSAMPDMITFDRKMV